MASSGGVQELLACQISAWYPAFARVTFKTAILPLPPAVADWLVSDGLHLAPDSQAVSTAVGTVVCVHAICCRGSQRTRLHCRRRQLPRPSSACPIRTDRLPVVCQTRAVGGVP